MKIKLMLIITFLKTLFIFCQTSETTQLDTLKVPIIFHINHSAKLSISQKNQFEKNLDKLILDFNDRINFVDYDNLINKFSQIAKAPNIKLYRPDCDLEDKSIKNIFWYKKSKIKNNIHIPVIDDIFLRLKSKDKNHFLNIWIVDLFDLGIQSNFCDIDATIKDIGGYTPSKFHIADGIVLDSDNINHTFLDPFLLIHEFGHYLGLKHIWGNKNGCQYDDGIFDTPLQKKAHDLNNLIVQESCNGGKTNHQNFMDYSYDTGMFTEDQVEVMRNNLKTKRAGLLWIPNCENEPITESKIDGLKALYYLYKINPREVPDYIAKQYLRRTDERNYYTYQNNEFELKRKIDVAKKSIVLSSQNINYNMLFKHAGDTYLRSSYSFTNQSFELKGFSNIINNLDDAFFKSRTQRFSFRHNTNTEYSTDPTRINFINEHLFSKISLIPSDAEIFKNSLTNTKIYYNIYFKILPESGINKYNKISELKATIEKVEFFSDESRSNLIHVIKI